MLSTVKQKQAHRPNGLVPGPPGDDQQRAAMMGLQAAITDALLTILKKINVVQHI